MSESIAGDHSVYLLIISNAYTHLKPSISTLIKTANGRGVLQRKLSHANWITFGILAITSIVIITFSSKLLALFGVGFDYATPSLIILAVGAAIGAAIGAAGRYSTIVLLLVGEEKKIVKWNGLELLALMIILPPATFYFSLLGTASATAVIMIVRNVYSVWFLGHKYRIYPLKLYTVLKTKRPRY